MKNLTSVQLHLIAAIVFTLITIVLALLYIWTGDMRWGYSAVAPGIIAFFAWVAYAARTYFK